MELPESLEINGQRFPLFDFELKWSVERFSTKELKMLINEVCDPEKHVIKLSSVADEVAKYLTNKIKCEFEPEKACIVSDDGITVGRLAIIVTKVNEKFFKNDEVDYLRDLVNKYLEKFFTDLSEVPVYDDKSKYKKEQKLVSKVHNVFQKLAAGHDSITFNLKLPGHKVIAVTARPKIKKVQELKKQFSGHVWCVDEHANTCGIQVGAPGEKGKSMRLNCDPARRDDLLNYQLLRTILQVEIEPYEHRGKIDGRLLSAEPVQGNLLG